MITWIDDNLAIGASEDADTPEELSRSDIDIVIEINRAVGLLHDLTDRGWKVMIKCFAGRDRSPFIAMMYVKQKQNLPVHEAYRYVMGRRPQTRPHYEWFDKMMEALEEKIE